MRSLLVVLLAYLAFLVAGEALADTGGSMGGGDWGGGGGRSSGGGGYSSGGGGGYSSGGGGGGWSSSSSSDWSSSGSSGPGCSSSSGSGGAGCDGEAAVVILLVIGGLFVVVTIVALIGSVRNPVTDESPFAGGPPVDVSVIRVAIDGRARKFVQAELKRIAGKINTGTRAGRRDMLVEVSMMLRKLRDAWVYGGAMNHPMRAIERAKPDFDRAVDDTRARFREEVIRNADGKTTRRTASDYTPRADEGEGLILVSIIIAANRELFTVGKIGNGDELRRALEASSQLMPSHLVAIEVVWQPAEDSDRLSSMELEAKYPFPEIVPLTNALVGKTFCDYCAGPFPAELVSCPHCGAPAPGREKPAA